MTTVTEQVGERHYLSGDAIRDLDATIRNRQITEMCRLAEEAYFSGEDVVELDTATLHHLFTKHEPLRVIRDSLDEIQRQKEGLAEYLNKISEGRDFVGQAVVILDECQHITAVVCESDIKGVNDPLIEEIAEFDEAIPAFLHGPNWLSDYGEVFDIEYYEPEKIEEVIELARRFQGIDIHTLADLAKLEAKIREDYAAGKKVSLLEARLIAEKFKTVRFCLAWTDREQSIVDIILNQYVVQCYAEMSKTDEGIYHGYLQDAYNLTCRLHKNKELVGRCESLGLSTSTIKGWLDKCRGLLAKETSPMNKFFIGC